MFISHSSFNTKFVRIVSAWALMILSVAFLNGQATATISGIVTDTSGAAVTGAKVDVRNIGTGAVQSAATDGQGRYTVPDLAIGDYEVQASQAGFQTVVRKGITLTVGSQVAVDFSVPVGQAQQTVTVEGQATQVETSSTTLSSLVDQTQMRELPLNGRNVEQLILLAPGVQSVTGSSQSTMYGRNNGYSVAGGRAEGQEILLDGQDMRNFLGRGTGASNLGTSLGIDAIAEFQTLTNTYSAQYGGAGAVINSVSKSGTNAFHGSAFEFLRNSALDARNFFDTAVLPGQSSAGVPAYRRNQFGGTIGGPIKKDKMFFFANYEGLRSLLGETRIATVPDADNRTPTTTNPASAAGVAATLAILPFPTTELGGGIGTVPLVANQIAHEDYVLGRFDYNLSAKDSIFVRYLSDRGTLVEPFPGTTTGATLPYWVEDSNNKNQFATIEERRIVSATLVNSLRFSFSRPGASGRTNPNTEPAALNFFPGEGRQDGFVSIPGISSLGPSTFDPITFAQNKFNTADEVIWTKGAHSLQFGANVLRNDTNTYFNYTEGSNWAFSSYALFLAGSASTLTGILPGPTDGNRDIRAIEMSPYIHDEWKVRSNLTLNLGVRYEWSSNPVEPHNEFWMVTNILTNTGFVNVQHPFIRGNPSKWNFDPRIGLAYDPFADHKTSFRAGFGLYHNLIEPRTYVDGMWPATPTNFAVQNNPIYPFIFSSVTPSALLGNPGFDPNTDTTPYMVQWNANMQRDIGDGTILTVGYVGSRGVHLFMSPIANTTIPTVGPYGLQYGTLTGTKITPNPRINPVFGGEYLLEPEAWSEYSSLQAALNRRFGRNVQFQASYTWSHCLDIGSTSFTGEGPASGLVQNPFNLAGEKGNCGFDIREAFRINGLVALPFHGNKFVEGWQVSGIVTASTGAPVTAYDGFDWVGLTAPTGSRPNASSTCSNLVTGSPNRWFNPICFTLQAPGTFGNAGRNTIPGPGVQNTDIALLKDTRIRENLNIQFRAEVFNVFNHANFAFPAQGIFSSVNTATSPIPTGIVAPNVGQITTTVNSSRQIQLGLKVIF